MLIARLLHNADGISLVFQPCKITKGIQLFPVARTKPFLFVLHSQQNNNGSYDSESHVFNETVFSSFNRSIFSSQHNWKPSEDVHLFARLLRSSHWSLQPPMKTRRRSRRRRKIRRACNRATVWRQMSSIIQKIQNMYFQTKF